MELLEQEIAGNSVLRWTIAALILVCGPLLLRALRRTLGARLRKLARRTENGLDDLIDTLVQRVHPIVLFLVPLGVASLVLTLPGSWGPTLVSVMVVALILQGGIWASLLLQFSLQNMLTRRKAADAVEGEESAPDPGTAILVRLAGRLVVWTVVVLLCLDNLGVDITALVAGLGVGGIAVALAVQNILSDLFASLSILIDKPFVVGDFIVVGEFMGTVEHIGVKTTRVRSLGGEQVVFSNADLLQSRIRNYKRMQERRATFTLGVVYSTPPDVLEQIPSVIRDIIEDAPNTRFDRAHFKTFAPSSLDFEVVYFMLSPEMGVYMDTQQHINLAICREFERLGIEFAYPTQTLFVQSVSEVVKKAPERAKKATRAADMPALGGPM